MAPPRNQQRRDALADAAIGILGTLGMHKLSHRAADQRAGLPAGTASNYFPSRDDLLEAAARRVVALQVAAMEAANRQVAGPAGPDELAQLIGASLYESATRYRTRSLAISELSLEATRRPALARALTQLGAATLEITLGQHRALGLPTSPGQVLALITLYGGTLMALATGPPEAVTPESALALARCLVAGVLAAGPGAPAGG